MKRFTFYALAFFLLLGTDISAMDWPAPAALITKNFGWNDNGLPRMGVTFEGASSPEAADSGELLFSRGEEDRASRLPSPLGSWAALDHGDGIVSIYGRFDGKSSREVPGKVGKGYTMGEAGLSGWSSGTGFYFQLFDRKERRWINPSLIIHPPAQTLPPQIMAVRLRDTQGRIFNPYQIGILPQGRYVVSVDAVSRNPSGSALAPQRIICSLNGSEAGVLNFETYSARDGSLMVYRNGLVPVKQIYAPVPAYEIAEVWFSRGQTTLEIITQDIAGSIRNVVYRFAVD